MSQKTESNDVKTTKARQTIIEAQRHGRGILFWSLDSYSDAEIVAAVEEAGYRWSEREQRWILQGSLFG